MLALRRAAGGAVDTHLCTICGGSNDYLNIYDVTDPTSPSLQSSTALSNQSIREANCQAEKNGYLYFVNPTGDDIHVYDISNPASPSRIYTLGGLATTPLTDPVRAYTHPDEDFLIIHGLNNSAQIWDISDPTSMSIVATDVTIGSVGVPTPDFTSWFSLQSSGTGLEKTPISSSGFGTSVIESLALSSNSRAGVAWSVSPVNAENYMWHGGANYLAIIEFGSDYTADSEYFVSDFTIWDRVGAMKSFDQYHSSSYESVAAVMARDLDKLNIVGYDGTNFTVLASDVPAGASLLGYGIDVSGYYVVSGDIGVDTFHIWEWDAETSVTLLSSTTDTTTLDQVGFFKFYTP